MNQKILEFLQQLTRSSFGIVLAVIMSVMASQRVSAVVIVSGDGSGNTTIPLDDPGFVNVGQMGVGSAVYLGNRWSSKGRIVRLVRVSACCLPAQALVLLHSTPSSGRSWLLVVCPASDKACCSLGCSPMFLLWRRPVKRHKRPLSLFMGSKAA